MPAKDNNIGDQIGNYRLVAGIGSGGYGRVFLGKHLFLTDRTVAIKLLHTHLASSEERDRALEEARLLEKLKHPNILQIFDVGIDEGFPYLVAEYASGGSLRERIKHYKPNLLPIEEILTTLLRIGQALQYAHQQNIIHRDLKPENILFNNNNEAMLADFGIATTLATTSVKAVTVLGTPLYMAPEQFKGTVSKESDQYSLGCIAYELVTGKAPFSAADFFALGFMHISETPVPPWELNPQLPVSAGQAILKAMAKQRTDRYASIQAFISALLPSFQAYTSVKPQIYSDVTYVHQASLSPLQELTQTGFPGMSQQVTNPSPDETNPHQQQLSSTLNKQQLALRGYEPITPLPLSIQTPPHALTPIPMQTQASPYEPVPDATLTQAPATYVQNPVTPLPELRPLLSAESKEANLPFTKISSQVMPEKARIKRSIASKRAWFIMVALCVLITSTFGVALLVFAQHTNTKTSTGTSLSQQTAASTLQTTGDPTRGATAGVSGNQKTPKPTTVSSPIATSVPTKAPTSKPTFGPTVTPNGSPTITPTVTTDTLTVPFTSNGVSTTHSYQGTVTITVSGTGQASQTQYSDAFYVYTDTSGNAITPYHPVKDCWILDINGQPADYSTSLPGYNSGHWYRFTINAPGGVLTFDECDAMRSDNTGSYNITVTQN